jgi:hypothetical protein
MRVLSVMAGRIFSDRDPIGGLFGSPPPLNRPHAAARPDDPDTSHHAKIDARLTAGAIRTKIYELVLASEDGMTVDEIRQVMPPMAASTLSARASDLIRDGWLEDSGRRRATRTGSTARILTARKEKK